jgi:hypothetical protein
MVGEGALRYCCCNLVYQLQLLLIEGGAFVPGAGLQQLAVGSDLVPAHQYRGPGLHIPHCSS